MCIHYIIFDLLVCILSLPILIKKAQISYSLENQYNPYIYTILESIIQLRRQTRIRC